MPPLARTASSAHQVCTRSSPVTTTYGSTSVPGASVTLGALVSRAGGAGGAAVAAAAGTVTAPQKATTAATTPETRLTLFTTTTSSAQIIPRSTNLACGTGRASPRSSDHSACQSGDRIHLGSVVDGRGLAGGPLTRGRLTR
ncbi:hypothetical protein GCM10009754_48700 [Amycolatopsis minnesotensis]|uniref:Uncharacterized protein n=1 Tax=Amycolatopsis minnesotensis TaxID=337894 RepID=A0ABP5CZ62_9PSEU